MVLKFALQILLAIWYILKGFSASDGSVSTKNVRNEWSGTIVYSLTSAALKLRNLLSQNKTDHMTQPAPLPIKNVEARSIVEKYKHLTVNFSKPK
jgi:hypothetical protein